jgi:thiol-disulfide isomerase/thioredoxin
MALPRQITEFTALLILAIGTGTATFGAPLPDLSLKDRAGTVQNLSAYRGKIVVLNFWATWCGPCREELPRLDELAREYAAKNVVFVAASIDEADTQPKIASFLGKKNVTSLPIWMGASPAMLKQFQLGEVVPATIILDQNGEPIARILGEASRKDIASRLDWLLNGRTGKQPKTIVKNY